MQTRPPVSCVRQPTFHASVNFPRFVRRPEESHSDAYTVLASSQRVYGSSAEPAITVFLTNTLNSISRVTNMFTSSHSTLRSNIRSICMTSWGLPSQSGIVQDPSNTSRELQKNNAFPFPDATQPSSVPLLLLLSSLPAPPHPVLNGSWYLSEQVRCTNFR